MRDHISLSHSEDNHLQPIHGGGSKSEGSLSKDQDEEVVSDEEDQDVDLTEDEENISESLEDSEEIEIEYTPKLAKPDVQDSANIKGVSEDFKEASATLRQMMQQKGKIYSIGGREAHIKSVTKNGVAVTIDVEVKTKSGEAGLAKLMIYTKKAICESQK